MKKRKVISIICLLAIVLGLVWAYISTPDTLILYKDREWQTDSISKVVSRDNSIEASKGAIVPRKTGDYPASYSIFGIPYKSVTVKVIDDETVIPGGQSVGIRLYSDGLVVVALGRINMGEQSPAETAGVKVGDVITHINGEKITNPDFFTEKIRESEGDVILRVKTLDKERDVCVTPCISTNDNVKRIGVWVRDSTAGVGTLTFVDPDTLTYGALGHAISDQDTGVKFDVLKGSIERCRIADIVKGEKGAPGELRGEFYSETVIMGDIRINEQEGIFGKLLEKPEGERVKLGHKSEVKKGPAVIRTSLDGENVGEYDIEIVKLSPGSKNASKGFVIQVTDDELIEKTGGIVQGMSGSPILQNGKLIGAVTHVLVNDPTRGNGIFIENMIEASCKD